MSRNNGNSNGKPLDTLKLYELSAEIEECLITTEDDPNWDPERFRNLKLAFEAKLDGCAKAIKNLEATEKAIRAHIKTQTARAAVIGNNAKALREYVKTHMERNRITKLNAGTHRFSVQQNSRPSIEVIDEAVVDEQWKNVRVQVNRDAIAQHFTETGEEPKGTRIEVKSHLRLS